MFLAMALVASSKPTIMRGSRLKSVGCRARSNRLAATPGTRFSAFESLSHPLISRRRHVTPKSQDPEEILGEMVTDKGEFEHRQKSSFDAVGDAIAQLDQCLEGNNTACEMLENNMEEDALDITPIEQPDEGF